VRNTIGIERLNATSASANPTSVSLRELDIDHRSIDRFRGGEGITAFPGAQRDNDLTRPRPFENILNERRNQKFVLNDKDAGAAERAGIVLGRVHEMAFDRSRLRDHISILGILERR